MLNDARRGEVELAEKLWPDDPALLLRFGAALMAIARDDDLARDVGMAAERIRIALPDEDVHDTFEAAEGVKRMPRA
jgi:hypothetical protein